ncbi:MAG: hypothetical protein EBZ77_01235, partial [Chitinophagia bacterium]|nr:hypothetical protein [Chitinophagia bacterium]
YVHIVGCVDAEEAGASIKGRTVDYGTARRTVRAVLDRVGEHVGGEWVCVKFRVTNNDAGDIAAYHRDAVKQRTSGARREGNDKESGAAGYTVAVYADDAAVDVVPGTHETHGVGAALSLASRVRLRVRAGDVVVRDSRLIVREVLTKHAASRRAVYMYGCYPSTKAMETYAPMVAHATTSGHRVLNGAVMMMCALMPRSMGILSTLAYANAVLGCGEIADPPGAYIASEGFQPRADVGTETGPTNVYVVVGEAPELDAARASEFTWVAYVRQLVVFALVVVFVIAVFVRITGRRN